ncbi:MAG: polysaccharide biosynthesis/export family protein [Acidobacteria bacterium]|nr:polysaccharide biosynthesis/export family protein [Acidobacteriota bacterium]
MRFLVGALLLVAGGLWGQASDEPKPRRKPAPAVEAENPAAAPAKAPAPAATLPPEAEPAFNNYQVGPEDLLSVMVMDSPEFTRQVRVSETGTFRMPLIKRPIRADGRTCLEIEHEITRALVEEGLLRDPAVSVTVREFNSKPVGISGAVRNPVVFQATRPLTLVEALSRAGGLAENAGSEVRITVPERDGQPASVVHIPTKSLTDITSTQKPFWLRGGEEVRVGQAGRVYILGGVTRPGALLVTSDEPLSLLRALALSGGTTPTASTKAFLLRPAAGAQQKTEVALDLKKLMRRQAPDLSLESNDVIFIPDSRSKRYSQAGITAVMSSMTYALGGLILWR